MDHPDQLRVRKTDKRKVEDSYTYDDVLSAAGFVRCPACEVVFQMSFWDCPSCGWTRP